MNSSTESAMPIGVVQVKPGFEDEANRGSVLARGGGAFAMSLFFLAIYYLRPQDWVPGLAGFGIVKPLIAMWLGIMIAFGVATPIRGLFKTPHDWAMLSYYLYVVWTAVDTKDAMIGFLPLVVFYFFTVQSIGSWGQLLKYLTWWNWLIITLALVAIASIYGLDLTGARELTAQMKGRLCIGTWIHNNPNALAHTVVVVVAVSYLLYFWRSNMLSKIFIFLPAAAVAMYCAYETESKGAFVVGGGLMVSVFVFGRPKFVQILVVATTLLVGTSALSFLPRMSQMGNLRADEGVQGRLLAWEKALEASEQNATGVGWKQFIAYIPWREGNHTEIIPKATHSSYVQIGADLGKYGMFLYLLSLWLALRSLIGAKSEEDDVERCRRILMVLLAANVVSGWMINREYHTEYFLLIAAAAVFHRLRLADREKFGEQEVLSSSDDRESNPRDVVVAEDIRVIHLGLVCERSEVGSSDGKDQAVDDVEDTERPSKQRWNKLSWIDVSVGVVITWLTFYVWDYIMKNI